MSDQIRPRDVFIVANNIEDLGGMTRFVLSLAELLAGRGYRVRLVGIVHSRDAHYDPATYGHPVTILHEADPPNYWHPPHLLHNLNVRRQIERRRRVSVQRSGAAKLTALIRQADDPIVIVTQVWAMEWVRLADTAGALVIGMSHESYQASRQSGRYARVKRFFAGADRFLLLTQRDADLWAFDGMTNAGYIPNPLGVLAERTSDLTAPTVVSLGRLAPEKGFDMLISAWARLTPRHPEWRLRIYGDGPLRASLQEQIDELELQGSVQLMGATTDVGAALQEASIYVLSSRSEGMPVVLTEAMEYGLPCIAFDVAPGVRELVTDESDGLVLPPGNLDALAAAMERLMVDPTLRHRLGEAAHASVQRFSPQVVADRWEQEFELLSL